MGHIPKGVWVVARPSLAASFMFPARIVRLQRNPQNASEFCMRNKKGLKLKFNKNKKHALILI